ncbi:sortase family protein [Enterococcus sp. LJL98]
MKKRKRNSLLKYFAIFMIFGGVIILLYPIVANYVANRERSEAVSNYSNTMKNISEVEKKQQLELAKKYNEYVFKRQQGIETHSIEYKDVLRLNEVMGTIDIPAIDIKEMPFYQGTDYQTLNKGLGHFETTSIPIGGENTRSVITGHSGVQNQVLFTDVLTLKEGDIFFINILGERLAYMIHSLEEVLPSEVEKVNIRSGKDEVTLLTCTPPGINTFRLLVNGKRIPYEEAIEMKVEKRNRLNYTNVVLTTLAINSLIFILLMGLYQYYVLRFRSNDENVAKNAAKHLKRLFFVTKTLFALLFISMIIVLGVALYGYFLMEEEPVLGTVDIGKQEKLSQYNLDKIHQADFDERQIASVRISDYAEAKKMTFQTTNQSGIGKLVIPSVGIDLPILAGIANQNLLTGASTYRPEQQLGMDNYVLLTHNIFDQDVLLHRIEDLNEGDLVYTTDFKDLFIYEVYLNEIVEDTEVHYIEKNEQNEEAMITLFRCEGDIGTRYRRLVQGKLKSVEPLKNLDEGEFTQLNLKRSSEKSDGALIKIDPISSFDKLGMSLAAKIVSDPMQTIVPLFLLFIMPILFFSLI